MNKHCSCSSVKEFNNVVKCIQTQLFTDIECVYNIGSAQYYEYPLFLFTKNNVFRIYFSESELSLNVFERNRFQEHCDRDIFRDPEYPQAFDYIRTETYYPNARICDMIAAECFGTERNLLGFDIVLSDGKRLCVRESDLVPYTMDSWVAE